MKKGVFNYIPKKTIIMNKIVTNKNLLDIGIWSIL